MTFTELGSSDELIDFINNNPVAIVVVSASWCGPCKRSKPEVMTIAKDSPVPFGYVLEDDIDLDEFGNIFLKSPISAFPTYVCFKDAAEEDRINGVQFPELKEMIAKFAPK
ncbi:Thioredoxin H-type [Seminavis robusta]|uniref:Thioredoxin H-type n=1 Tax=Seminavis robusta TaxID=568900 RepID=A0A9N8HWN3_9STRA|nr:Thioredoxin H-type [Seminavis robusta]|eukprot:Sro2008_g310660.1 Thioredoxin H-type (111) ;mRNA; r:17204-17536